MNGNIAYVLVIEDNEDDRRLIANAFARHPTFAVTYAVNAKEGEAQLYGHSFDIAVIDNRLPDKSGRQIIRDARQANLTLPIMMLTGDNEESSVVDNIKGGANGYMTKPFRPEEFVARLEGLLRDWNRTADQLIPFRDLVFDTAWGAVMRNGKTLFNLPPKQAHIFEALLRSRKRFLSDEDLMAAAWRDERTVEYLTVRRNAGRINEFFARKKLPQVVRFVTGAGYELLRN